jgi:protein phosphatase
MVYNGNVIYAHVGDSRAYMIGDKITQITRDHSFVQELVKLGQITAEEAKHHPRRNYITRAMGVEPIVRVDTGVKLYNNEAILLSSDGLTGEINDDELYTAVKGNAPEEALKALIDLANERGGGDNITAVIMEGEDY